MTRIIITAILLLLLTGSASAQDSTLYLPQVGGETASIGVAEVPIILDGDHAIIVNCTGQRLSVARITTTAVQLVCEGK